MRPFASCVDQASPTNKSEGILELKRELARFVPEQEHREQTTGPTTNGTDCSQVELAYPITARTTRPELVPGKQGEGHYVRQPQPKQKEVACRESLHLGQAKLFLIITFTNRVCHS